MKRLKAIVVLAMLAFATFLPGASLGVSAQGFDLCAGALEHGEGTYAGYTVVYGSGGAGDQIVLGSLDGNDYLSGGSGNDVLCAWGNANTLDGGSGSDVLIAVDGEDNVLLGGSGNDTLMGYTNNTFDGGSGRNEIVEWEPVQGPRIVVTIGPFQNAGDWYCGVLVELVDFPDELGGLDYVVTTILSDVQYPSATNTTLHTDGNGYGSGIGISFLISSGTIEASTNGVTSGEIGFTGCMDMPALDL